MKEKGQSLYLLHFQKTANGYEFDCQHGPAECYANKFHACAVKQLEPKIRLVCVCLCVYVLCMCGREIVAVKLCRLKY